MERGDVLKSKVCCTSPHAPPRASPEKGGVGGEGRGKILHIVSRYSSFTLLFHSVYVTSCEIILSGLLSLRCKKVGY